MAYPLRPHQEQRIDVMTSLMRARPFAHLFTSQDGQHCVTRLPFMLDAEGDTPKVLRAHMNAQNPQAAQLGGAPALVAFSGPDNYVSPNWRTKSDRGATWDYTAVHVWGQVTIRPEREFFEQLITDLAAAAEPQFEGVSDKPDWSLANVTPDYIDRLFPQLISFEIAIDDVKGISKLHQDFPKEDALSVAAHLEKIEGDDSSEIASLITSAAKRNE